MSRPTGVQPLHQYGQFDSDRAKQPLCKSGLFGLFKFGVWILVRHFTVTYVSICSFLQMRCEILTNIYLITLI